MTETEKEYETREQEREEALRYRQVHIERIDNGWVLRHCDDVVGHTLADVDEEFHGERGWKAFVRLLYELLERIGPETSDHNEWRSIDIELRPGQHGCTKHRWVDAHWSDEKLKRDLRSYTSEKDFPLYLICARCRELKKAPNDWKRRRELLEYANLLREGS